MLTAVHPSTNDQATNAMKDSIDRMATKIGKNAPVLVAKVFITLGVCQVSLLTASLMASRMDDFSLSL